MDDLVVRLIECIEVADKVDRAAREYFGIHGCEHSLDDCPEDDTCECPEVAGLRESWNEQFRVHEIAKRTLHRVTGKAFCTLVDEYLERKLTGEDDGD